MTRLRAATILAVAFLAVPGFAAIAEPERSFGRALRDASAARKPLLVKVGADWCSLCKEMDRTTLVDPGFLAVEESFVSVRVDADSNALLMNRYELEELPVILALDGEGQELARLTGVVPAAELVPRLRSISGGYLGYVLDKTQKRDPAALERVGAYLEQTGAVERAASFYRRALRQTGSDDPETRARLQALLEQMGQG